jgi:hypothetical protein
MTLRPKNASGASRRPLQLFELRFRLNMHERFQPCIRHAFSSKRAIVVGLGTQTQPRFCRRLALGARASTSALAKCAKTSHEAVLRGQPSAVEPSGRAARYLSRRCYRARVLHPQPVRVGRCLERSVEGPREHSVTKLGMSGGSRFIVVDSVGAGYARGFTAAVAPGASAARHRADSACPRDDSGASLGARASEYSDACSSHQPGTRSYTNRSASPPVSRKDRLNASAHRARAPRLDAGVDRGLPHSAVQVDGQYMGASMRDALLCRPGSVFYLSGSRAK